MFILHVASPSHYFCSVGFYIKLNCVDVMRHSHTVLMILSVGYSIPSLSQESNHIITEVPYLVSTALLF